MIVWNRRNAVGDGRQTKCKKNGKKNSKKNSRKGDEEI